MIYFTADFHFEHAAIIEFCKRPFRSAPHMDSQLIKNYNEVVQPDDTVYIVGDFSIRRRGYKMALWNIVDKLKGQKHLILGNHDYLEPFDYVDMGFVSVHTALKVDEFILAHDPSIACAIGGKTLLHGHVHDLFLQQENAINVGVDVWDFAPVGIDVIREMIEED
jgi:calcineurin-like phosphoesterase family protein